MPDRSSDDRQAGAAWGRHSSMRSAAWSWSPRTQASCAKPIIACRVSPSLPAASASVLLSVSHPCTSSSPIPACIARCAMMNRVLAAYMLSPTLRNNATLSRPHWSAPLSAPEALASTQAVAVASGRRATGGPPTMSGDAQRRPPSQTLRVTSQSTRWTAGLSTSAARTRMPVRVASTSRSAIQCAAAGWRCSTARAHSASRQ